jgi:dolichol-phosphate mannosyltransferase
LRPIELSIIVPTFNERGNLGELIARMTAALEDVSWEVIFVDDDSADGTALAARECAQSNPRVRCIRRIGRRGLASACIEGMLASSARFLAVMDADLQHDPAQIRSMLELLQAGGVDVVIGSRYVSGGSVGAWDERRLAMSQLATRLALLITHTPVSDPMSGYFALRRDVFEACVKRLSNLGFKILLDIIASSDETLRVQEVPIIFGTRLSGESKISTNVIWEFLLLLLDKLVGRYVPVRFVAFAGIGAVGIGVHFAVLSMLFKGLGMSFALSQAFATGTAILFNYVVNNTLTYADSTLRGVQWVKGLLSFYLICAIGATANIGLASYLFLNRVSWELAAMAGIALSAVWNFALSARYTWGKA